MRLNEIKSVCSLYTAKGFGDELTAVNLKPLANIIKVRRIFSCIVARPIKKMNGRCHQTSFQQQLLDNIKSTKAITLKSEHTLEKHKYSLMRYAPHVLYSTDHAVGKRKRQTDQITQPTLGSSCVGAVDFMLTRKVYGKGFV